MSNLSTLIKIANAGSQPKNKPYKVERNVPIPGHRAALEGRKLYDAEQKWVNGGGQGQAPDPGPFQRAKAQLKPAPSKGDKDYNTYDRGRAERDELRTRAYRSKQNESLVPEFGDPRPIPRDHNNTVMNRQKKDLLGHLSKAKFKNNGVVPDKSTATQWIESRYSDATDSREEARKWLATTYPDLSEEQQEAWIASNYPYSKEEKEQMEADKSWWGKQWDKFFGSDEPVQVPDIINPRDIKTQMQYFNDDLYREHPNGVRGADMIVKNNPNTQAIKKIASQMFIL